jgi:hypothetical protein
MTEDDEEPPAGSGGDRAPVDGDAEPTATDDTEDATAAAADEDATDTAQDGSTDRAHPWAPYDRDETDQAASFDAPTRDVRPGVDYDVTERHDDPERLREQLVALEQRLDEFESDVERRTMPREEVEDELRRYVRRRLWRGHARGWGPYLVLLYGTVMTLGAFVELDGIWAIAAMLVLWLSTLGLYVFMIVVGVGIGVLALPWKFKDRLSDWRSS